MCQQKQPFSCDKEVVLYLLQQVSNHQKPLSSQHLLLHGHRALEQLNQKGQESSTAKQDDITSHTGVKQTSIHTLIRWRRSYTSNYKEETVRRKEREREKEKVIFRGCQQSAGASGSPLSSLLHSEERFGSLGSTGRVVWRASYNSVCECVREDWGKGFKEQCSEDFFFFFFGCRAFQLKPLAE